MKKIWHPDYTVFIVRMSKKSQKQKMPPLCKAILST